MNKNSVLDKKSNNFILQLTSALFLLFVSGEIIGALVIIIYIYLYKNIFLINLL